MYRCKNKHTFTPILLPGEAIYHSRGGYIIKNKYTGVRKLLRCPTCMSADVHEHSGKMV